MARFIQTVDQVLHRFMEFNQLECPLLNNFCCHELIFSVFCNLKQGLWVREQGIFVSNG